jgi:hypothetical protein
VLSLPSRAQQRLPRRAQQRERAGQGRCCARGLRPWRARRAHARAQVGAAGAEGGGPSEEVRRILAFRAQIASPAYKGSTIGAALSPSPPPKDDRGGCVPRSLGPPAAVSKWLQRPSRAALRRGPAARAGGGGRRAGSAGARHCRAAAPARPRSQNGSNGPHARGLTAARARRAALLRARRARARNSAHAAPARPRRRGRRAPCAVGARRAAAAAC